MGDVFIDGVGQTEFGKDERRLEVMLADAVVRALDDSKCKECPDRIIIGNYNYEGYAGQASLDALLGAELGMPTITPIRRVERGSSTGALAVEVGLDYAQHGEKVLVVSGETMWLEGIDGARITYETSKVIDEDERKFGLTMPIIAAIATREYMARYGISEEKIREIFFQILNENRLYGSKNPSSYFKNQLSEDDYFNNPEKNPIIASPLTRNDCAGVYNGAAAVYLVPDEEKVKEPKIKLSGIRSAYSPVRINGRRTLTSMDATVDAARAVFKDANLNPHEIDIVELHDAFASIPIIAAEDLGFVERGKGYEFILNEKNNRGRSVYYNRSGGFLSKTHPIAASGTAQLVELVLQMRGIYKEDTNYGLWLSVDGFGFYNSVGIIEKIGPSVREREDLKEENLPSRLELSRKDIKKYGGKLVGMTTIPDDVNDFPGIGVIRTPEGELRLGHIGELDKLQLGKRVDLIEGEDGLCFVPVSNRVIQTLQRYRILKR